MGTLEPIAAHKISVCFGECGPGSTVLFDSGPWRLVGKRRTATIQRYGSNTLLPQVKAYLFYLTGAFSKGYTSLNIMTDCN